MSIVLVAFACEGPPQPTQPQALATCARTAPAISGSSSFLPVGADCVTLTVPGRYAVSYLDARFIDGARVAHEAEAPDLDDLTIQVGWAGAGGFFDAVSAARVPSWDLEEAEPEADDWIRIAPVRSTQTDDELGDSSDGRAGPRAVGSKSCGVDPGLELFCRDRPWSVGDTLTLPAPFGLLIHDAPRAAEVLVVRDPFVFVVRRDLPEEARAALQPILAQLALVGRLRVIPFLRRSLIDREVFTSAGSRQILVDTSFDDDAVCVCGVAIGTYAQGSSVSGISIRIPAGREFEAHRVGLFSHELTHIWQHAFDTQRIPDPETSVAPTTRWAVEGGADFVRQEIIRGLAAEPLEGNRDASARFANPYLERLIREFGVADGQIRNGYAQTAGMLRHLFVRALDQGASYDDALQSVMRGSLEGWFGSPGASVSGVGITQRLSDSGVPFDPAQAVLEYATANAVDDRLGDTSLRNPAVLDAWRPSLGSSFIPKGRILPRGPGVRASLPAGGVGYVYVRHEGGPQVLRLESPRSGVRWMVTRFE